MPPVQASGSVLEVGVGTGLNLPLYTTSGPGAVSQLTGVDLSSQMLGQAQQRAQTFPGFSLTDDGSSPSLQLRQVNSSSTHTCLPLRNLACAIKDPSLCLFVVHGGFESDCDTVRFLRPCLVFNPLQTVSD